MLYKGSCHCGKVAFEFKAELTGAVRAHLETYVAARHTGRASAHDYRFEDTGLDLAEHRPLVQPYQDRFGVVSEVEV